MIITYVHFNMYFCLWQSPLIEPKVLYAGQSGEITTGHLLLGIWSEESAGRKILATLGFNDEKAKEVEKTVSIKFFLSS